MVKIIIGFGIFKLNKRVVLGIIIKKTLKKNILSINFVEKDLLIIFFTESRSS
jgi:hypothetical protein